MEPSKFPSLDLYKFGAGGQTIISPFVLALVCASCIAILFLPRKYIIWAYLIPIVVIPNGQVIMVGMLHVRMTQIINTIAVIRLLRDHGASKITKNSLDQAFVLWAVSSAIIYVLRWRSGDVLVNQLRGLFDNLATYYVLRFLIRDEKDICRTIRVFAVICCIIGFSMAIEHQTGRNPFAMLGGVRELSEVRNGNVRSQGPFEQAIPAGVFGAVLVPLFVGLCVPRGEGKGIALLGIPFALIIAASSGSSTPLLAIGGSILTFMAWPIRRKMQWVRWGIVGVLVVLEIVMKSDFWWIIARIDVTGSSTGWYRSALIDNAIHHFWEWWLLGTNNNANWGYGMYDLCNWYVAQAVLGGLLTFIFFLVVIVRAFRRLGITRKAVEGNFRKGFFVWAICAGLFAQVCSFFGTSYYDQTIVPWFALLAIISAVTRTTRPARSAEDETVVVGQNLEFVGVGAGLEDRVHL